MCQAISLVFIDDVFFFWFYFCELWTSNVRNAHCRSLMHRLVACAAWVRNVWILEREGLSERAVTGSWRHLLRCCVAVVGNFPEEKERWRSLAVPCERGGRVRSSLTCTFHDRGPRLRFRRRNVSQRASSGWVGGAVVFASCRAVCACVELHSVAERVWEKKLKWGRGIGETRETPPGRAGNDRSGCSKGGCASSRICLTITWPD